MRTDVELRHGRCLQKSERECVCVCGVVCVCVCVGGEAHGRKKLANM